MVSFLLALSVRSLFGCRPKNHEVTGRGAASTGCCRSSRSHCPSPTITAGSSVIGSTRWPQSWAPCAVVAARRVVVVAAVRRTAAVAALVPAGDVDAEQALDREPVVVRDARRTPEAREDDVGVALVTFRGVRPVVGRALEPVLQAARDRGLLAPARSGRSPTGSPTGAVRASTSPGACSEARSLAQPSLIAFVESGAPCPGELPQ